MKPVPWSACSRILPRRSGKRSFDTRWCQLESSKVGNSGAQHLQIQFHFVRSKHYNEAVERIRIAILH